MLKSSMSGTKWDLFKASIDLFFQYGYSNVSIRDIAKSVGIKSSSIYHHFKSKDAILEQIYKFYSDSFLATLPNLEELIGLINKIDPIEILRKLDIISTFDKTDIMSKILTICLVEKTHDNRAEELLVNFHMKMPEEYFGTLLTKMIKLDIIEPLDIKTWITILTHYDFITIIKEHSTIALTTEEWNRGREFLFNIIRCK